MPSTALAFASLFRAAASAAAIAALHADAIRRGVLDAGDSSSAHTATSLLASYGRLGLLDDAFKMFDEMPSPTTVTYNALLSRCARSCHDSRGLALFRGMLSLTRGPRPNEDTIVAALSCCAGLAALPIGRAVHAVALRGLAGANAAAVATALIHAYAKCGSVDAARKVFDRMGTDKDAPAWTAMVSALAMHARGEEALALFEEMRTKGRVLPDSVAFTCAIQACGHSGLAERGMRLFDEMTSVYGITPRKEHYGALVDLLCRAGRFPEAEAVVAAMPVEPTREVWGTLLHAYASSRIRLSETLEKRIRELRFGDGEEGVGFYVGVSNAYARSGMWDEVWRVRERMVEKGVKKEKGFSLVEVNGKVTRFLVGDVSHPLTLELYELLDWINLGMMFET